jgi:hypothetical protein
MEDHDQRFKRLLREFFPEFLALFFPEWSARLDAERGTWLEQEAALDPPAGRPGRLDLVARVPLREPRPATGAPLRDHIVHVEVESGDRAARLRPRMFEYYTHLRRRYRLPVLPIGLFLRAGLGGVGRDVYEDRLRDWAVIRFEYASVGLPAIDGLSFARGNNPLGVALASLMRLPTAGRPKLMIEVLRRIHDLEVREYQRFLLAECVEAYFPLSKNEWKQYRRLTRAPENQEVRVMLTFSQAEGQRTLIERQLEKRFGPLSPAVRGKLEDWPNEKLADLALALLDAASLRDLGLEDAPAPKTRKKNT